jgi:hypothetical protein
VQQAGAQSLLAPAFHDIDKSVARANPINESSEGFGLCRGFVDDSC